MFVLIYECIYICTCKRTYEYTLIRLLILGNCPISNVLHTQKTSIDYKQLIFYLLKSVKFRKYVFMRIRFLKVCVCENACVFLFAVSQSKEFTTLLQQQLDFWQIYVEEYRIIPFIRIYGFPFIISQVRFLKSSNDIQKAKQ